MRDEALGICLLVCFSQTTRYPRTTGLDQDQEDTPTVHLPVRVLNLAVHQHTTLQLHLVVEAMETTVTDRSLVAIMGVDMDTMDTVTMDTMDTTTMGIVVMVVVSMVTTAMVMDTMVMVTMDMVIIVMDMDMDTDIVTGMDTCTITATKKERSAMGYEVLLLLLLLLLHNLITLRSNAPR